MLGDEYSLELVLVRIGPPRHNRKRHHCGCIKPAQAPQGLILAVGDELADLLDRDDPPRQVGEPDDMAGDASGERRDVLLRPTLQRKMPRKVEQGRFD